MFKSKLKAAAIHGSVTLVVAAVTACLVYLVWFKGAFAEILSGTDLFLLVLGVELCLGPLMSLVIYNPDKSRKELVRDYAVVGVVQLVALLYGLYSVALSRPVFLVFVKDRIEVVVAVELKIEDLLLATNVEYKHLPWFGSKSLCTESPSDPHEKSDLLTSALSGKDIQLLPKYYRECKPHEVIDKALKKEQLALTTSISLNELPQDFQSTDFKWLPVMTRFGNGIVVYENNSVESATYLNVDPYLTRK